VVIGCGIPVLFAPNPVIQSVNADFWKQMSESAIVIGETDESGWSEYEIKMR
jgi:hypothetical protein